MNSIQKELVHKLKCIELNIGRPEDTQRTVALAWMEIEILSQELGNLLAIIHRDGGHHTDAVGEKQSVEDAHKVWAKLMNDNERLRAALEPFACTCSVKGMGAGGNCTKGSGECMCWNARAALNDQPAPGKGE